jgi:serine/threonine protein kinase
MIDLELPFVLASDVRLISAEDLTKSDLARSGCQPGDVVLSRHHARALAKALDPAAASLVRLFSVPTTLVEAITKIARESDIAAAEALDAYSGVLRTLINQGFLVQQSQDDQDAREPFLKPGQNVDGFEVVRCVHMYDDTELHQVYDASGRSGALKIARTDSATTGGQLAREADLHKALVASVAPLFIAQGKLKGRPYLVVEWRNGRAVTAEADAVRAGNDGWAGKILDLCLSVLDAFATLHASGVVHGDIHPNNVLAGPDGKITVLDYGYARLLRGPRRLTTCKRGGVGFFFEPEYAEARLRDRPPPVSTPRGEQYALAVLIYLLLTGQHHTPFSFDERTMFEQIRSEHPRSFGEIGCTSWPSVEQVLATALHKNPARRFVSLGAFAAALRSAGKQPPAQMRKSGTELATSSALSVLLAEVVGQLGVGGPLTRLGLNFPPKASVHSGASGIAYALHRIACAREDSALLAAASLWSQRALRLSDDPDAYFDPKEGVTEATVGRSSIAHSVTGTAFVHGLIAEANGDVTSATKTIQLFSAASKQDCPNPDLFLGRAGLLHACSTLIGAMAKMGEHLVDSAPIIETGNTLHAGLLNELAFAPPIGESDNFDNLGMAHGWSGYLFALMAWSRARGEPMPPAILLRLEQLAACAVTTENGLRWPIRVSRKDASELNYMPGWCNGGTGHILTWLLAAEIFAESEFSDLAVRAANEVLAADRRRTVPFLCCGMTGTAYAMLALYRSSGDPRWLNHAHRLAQDAAETIRSPKYPFTSLFRGATGLAVLAAELREPRFAQLPIFGRPELVSNDSSSARLAG